MIMSFVVPGKPVGYYSVGKVPNWARMKQYHSYMMEVQRCAKLAGIALPLTATKDAPILIKTKAYFPNGVHCDPENVRKGVSDALFYGGSGDKHTGGSFPPPLYDKANPRVEVEIVTHEL